MDSLTERPFRRVLGMPSSSASWRSFLQKKKARLNATIKKLNANMFLMRSFFSLMICSFMSAFFVGNNWFFHYFFFCSYRKYFITGDHALEVFPAGKYY